MSNSSEIKLNVNDKQVNAYLANGGVAGLVDDGARQGDLDHVAVPVQVAALAAVIGDAVARVEFEAAGNQHGGFVS